MFIGVGLEWSGDPSSGSVTVTATVTACSDGYGHNWTNRWSWWGYYGSGSESFSFSSGYGQTVYKQLSQWSFTVPLEYGREKTVTIGASLGPIWNGGNPSVENWITLPARPVELPNAPTKVTASRVSDQQINIEWVAPSSGESNPIDYFVVERRLDDSDQWMVIAPVKDAVSVVDMDVQPGHKYSYRVKSDNAAGGSEYVEAERPVFTTPPAPVNVRAVKDASGNIVVTWENRAPYVPTRWEVYDGDGKLAALVTLDVESCTWEHSSPRLDVTHQYRIVCVGGSMSSARSEPSNVVQLLARPNSPEPTSDGLYFPADEPVTLGWRFNATDSSPQTRFKLQYMRRQGGVNGPVFDQATSRQEWSVGVLPQGTYEYWVQTWGLHADPSPVSRRALFYVETRPVISIQSPGQVVKTSFIDVSWAYSSMGGPTQTKAIVELHQGETLVESQVVRGSQVSVRLKTYLKNGVSYRVSVTAVNAHGVKSKTVKQSFRVEYEQPPAPRVYPEWDDEVGCVRVRVVNPAPEAGKPAAVRNRVERSIDGWTWTILTEDLPVSGLLLDYQSPSHGSVSYRVTATSDLPSSSTTTESIDVESWAMWIGGGQDFSTTVALRWNPVHSCKTGLDNRKLHRFAGREKPVEMSGRHREKSLSLSAVLFDEDFPLIQRLEDLSYLPAPFLYRDPMGRCVYCSVASVSVDRALSGKWSVKIEVEEVDYE
jgi:hypothetical protein